ncbi:MAG: hypothetical protein ACK5Q5_17375 [Planctomycetaceae bacterium]
MSDARLLDRLEGTIARIRRLRLYYGLAWGWIAGLVVALAVLLLLGWPVWVAVLLGTLLAIGWGLWCSWPQAGDLRQAAQLVEAQYPELDSRLLTAVDQQPQVGSGIFSYLQMVVLGDVLKHARQQDWRYSIPRGRMWGAQLVQVGTLLLFAVALTMVSRHRAGVAAAIGLPSAEGMFAGQPSGSGEDQVRVSPGDVELERGTGLLVTAEFSGTLPGQVELVAVDADRQERRLPLVKSLDDPVFGGRIAEVAGDLTYRVVFDGGTSPDFKVTTFEFPRLEQADADVHFPSYTGLADEHLADVRRLSVVEGSEIQLQLQLNKPVTSATLTTDENRTLTVEASSAHPLRRLITLTPSVSGNYTLQLVDEAGRQNKDPVAFVVDVIPNRPPEIKLAFPAKDQKVSPLQEMALEGEAWDDFGLSEHGLILEKPDGSEEQLLLGARAQANVRSLMTHQLDLEPLGVEPDDLVSFYFYADDVGPDGQTRRAYSDMFFAEVRPFEELYRQAPNQPGSGEGGACKKLIQLQRQVVSGTWNLIRQEPVDPPQASFVDDATTLSESQTQIKELAETFAAGLEDLLMQQFASEAISHMNSAQQQFADAADQATIKPLPDGRDAARRAYASLLKLQAREHAVRNPSQGQGQGSEGRNLNEQLKALELKNDRHRYETEQQVRQEQDAAAREALQVLSRLRELARRQEDLNERIRQLENQLRDAKTDAERDALQRQLKRLQQEQQDLLRDVDELRERMNREENRPRMAEARDALDQTRERIYQSSEALKQEQTSQALTQGTRAQRELDQLKEQMREQTAGRFDEQLRTLREDVRALAEQEEQIAEQLRGQDQREAANDTLATTRQRPSLREQPSLRTAQSVQNREQSVKQLAAQQQRLSEVLEQMRSLVEAAEGPEPLLSKRLYDAMRATRVDKPEEALAAASELVRRGFDQPAQEAEAQARAGINKLKTGIEQAAESVLGNEDEALRRARADLALLTDSVARELAENDRQFARERQQQAQASNTEQPQPQRQDQSRSPSNSATKPTPSSDSPETSRESADRSTPSTPGQTPRPNSAGQPSEQPGQQSQPGQTPSPSGPPSSQSGQQPGQTGQQSNQPGQASASGSQSGPSGQAGSSAQSPSAPANDSPSSALNAAPTQAGGSGGGQPSLQDRLRTSLATETNGGGNAGPTDPLTGSQFIEWSDRMRDIEEMLSDPELRADVASIREKARAMRIEFKRHSMQPNWELVRLSIYGPMRELEQRLADELARRADDDRLVPIDRDPVPDQYADLVKRYYQELSRQP